MIDETQLTSFIKQNTVQFSTTSYVEEYKCKTTTAFNVMPNFRKGEDYGAAVGHLGSREEAVTSTPTAPSKMKWVLAEATLSESDGGDNSIVRLEFTLVDNEDGKDVFVKDISLTWKPYSMSILGFCANDDIHTDKYTNEEDAPDDQTCVSDHISKYLKTPATGELSSDTCYAYGVDIQLHRKLNPRETQIAKKINSGIEYAYYHTPVMTFVEESKVLSTDWKSDNPFDDVSEVIDTITNLPYDVIDLVKPVWAKEKEEANWNWVNTIDNVQCVFSDNLNKNHIWRRTRQFEGTINPDVNLYGNSKIGEIDGRWQVGGM